MSGGIDTAGDIATGLFVARAVEPPAGETAHRPLAHGLCLNCGTALHGEFCHACGQSGHVHRSLHSIGHDLLHGVFHFEGKIWRTVPMLVFQPGALTRRYIAGERARFVSPLALFLFAVFLMFATIHAFGGELGTDLPPAARETALQNIDADIAKGQAKLARLQTAPRRANADAKIAKVQEDLRSLQVARSVMDGGSGVTIGDVPLSGLRTDWHALDKGIAKVKANPGLALYKLQSSAYKYSWALIPISTPFVALLFLWRRRYKLYDHAIFVTYSLAFMMMLVASLSTAGAIGVGSGLIGLLVMFVPPVHMFAQLRGAYTLRKRSALWRTVALIVFAWIALTAFACLLLAMGIME
ncbi:DUF3667 domain-containing protein [Sphingomonas sp. 10B4]|uniref:DUF3667 domain-containing protein n=1 Tax=Sphingomonas sp. 10B4 TaxID=3048575 RepID=UPI002AB4FF29|nr:DUF3667 domain-containing protein [Sphingomonas sp. 10B4]MDY7523792.1 DUF3667 domain-containing protein [Sphingomonas sp. 10B4]MEB0282969.1 DUF3667 domain-containing protein [Sphingomonas sp. 10B4]